MAVTAETNKASLAWGLEVTNWGLVSTEGSFAAPSLTYARHTGESVKYNKGVVTSQEIRSDGNIVDHIEVSADVSGDIQAELTYATFDSWFKVLLTPDGAAGTGDGVSPVAATLAGVTSTSVGWSVIDTNTFQLASGNLKTLGFVAGMWIKTSGFASAANNGVFKISAVISGGTPGTNDQIDVTATSLVTVVAGPSVTVKGKMFRNGTNKVLGVGGTINPSLVFEKQYTDLSNVFEHYTGCRFNQLQITMNAQQILTLAWSVMGRRMLGTSATIDADATITAANTNTVMNATSNVLEVEEGGTVTTVPISTISLTVKRNLANLTQVGNKFPFEQRFGWFEVEGKLNAYFQTVTLRDKFLNHTATSLRITVIDASSNYMVFTIPKVRLTESSGNVISGPNASVMTELTFKGYFDSTTNCSFQLDIL